MRRNLVKCQRSSHARRGVMLPTLAIMLPILVILVGYSINVAYMELVQAELRVNCDAAAKAALVNYGATQNQASAISFAQSISGKNTVVGKNFVIPSSQFIFGNSTQQANGSYLFTVGGTPINSIQVTGSATVPLPMGATIPYGNYTCSKTAHVKRISHDIVLVLDRSGSMAFDLSGNEFVYPPDRTLYSPLQSYFTSPSPTASRWAALDSAVDSFIAVLQSRSLDVNVGLVTYAENYSLGNYSATETTLDVTLTSNFNSITAAMEAYGNKPLLGDTNIAAGLALGQSELTGPRSRKVADRTIILLTDGVATTGSTDIASLTASYRSNSSVVTHVITFGGEAATGSIQSSMMSAAANGNGMFFNAATAAQLQAAFQEIADSLPAVLVK